MSDAVQTLMDLGFEPAGEWILDNGRTAPHLSGGRSDRQALYAFVHGGEVVYIGRMNAAFGGQIGTDEPLGLVKRYTTENDKRIIETLMTGGEIQILAFAPRETMEFRGWRVNIGAGLQDALIAKVQPAWNRGGGGPPKSTRPF